MNLYKISNSYQGLMYQLNELENISEENLLELDNIKEDFSNKAINVAAYIKNMEAEESAIKEAIFEMKEREKRISGKIESLKKYLTLNLSNCDITEIKSIQFDIKIKKCPPSVNIINDSFILDEYKSTKEIVSIDKNKIKNDILNGVIVDGAEIVYNTRLEIK